MLVNINKLINEQNKLIIKNIQYKTVKHEVGLFFLILFIEVNYNIN